MKRIISLFLSAVLIYGALSTVSAANTPDEPKDQSSEGPASAECEHNNTEWQQVSDGCALVCTDCGMMLSDEEPHDFEPCGEYTDEEDYENWGCTEERYREQCCSRCGCYTSEWIEPLGHNFVDGFCTRCGAEYCDHEWIMIQSAHSMSCLEHPLVQYMCDNCYETKNSNYTAVNHHYVEGVCEVCGFVRPPESNDVTLLFKDKEDDSENISYGEPYNKSFEIVLPKNAPDDVIQKWTHAKVAVYAIDKDGNITVDYSRVLFSLNGSVSVEFPKEVGTGTYTVRVEVYPCEEYDADEILTAETSFDYTGWNGAELSELTILYFGVDQTWGPGMGSLDVTVKAESEDGLPVQDEPLHVMIYKGDIVFEEFYYFNTSSDGILNFSLWIDYDEYTDGEYTLVVRGEENPEIEARANLVITKPKEPVFHVTVDKDSYDCNNILTFSVSITNEDGTTEGLEWLEASENNYDIDIFLPNGEIHYGTGGRITVPVIEGKERLSYCGEEYAGICRLKVSTYIGKEYSGYAEFDYTGQIVPCEGEHVWGEYVEHADGHYSICDLCGAESELEPHVVPDEWKTQVTSDAGCYYLYKECTVCGRHTEITDTVHPCEHFVERATEQEPGCDYCGNYIRYIACYDCNEWIEVLEWHNTAPLGHNFVDGVCTRCGAEADGMGTLTLDKTEAGDGELITASYTLTDVEGNPIPGVNVSFYSDLFGTYLTRTTDENGVAVLKFRPSLTYQDENTSYGNDFGEYILEAYAYEFVTSNAYATFEFVDKDVPEENYTVQLEVSPDFIDDYSIAQDYVTYTVAVLDENGAPVPGVNVTFETWYGEKLLFSNRYITNDDGTAEMSIGLYEDEETPAGTYTVIAKAGDASASDTFVFIHETEEDDTLAGDCNGDGLVNNKDVVALFRYVSYTDAEYDKVYDFNGDNSVNNKDIVALFKFISSNF